MPPIPVPEDPPTPDPEETDNRRAADPELLAMGQILRKLYALGEPARGRVIRWLAARYAADDNGPQTTGPRAI